MGTARVARTYPELEISSTDMVRCNCVQVVCTPASDSQYQNHELQVNILNVPTDAGDIQCVMSAGLLDQPVVMAPVIGAIAHKGDSMVQVPLLPLAVRLLVHPCTACSLHAGPQLSSLLASA